MSAGHFTSGGHFILLRGVTLDGNILVADPNSRARSSAGMGRLHYFKRIEFQQNGGRTALAFI